MPIFQYEAKNMQGTSLNGKIEAVDEASVVQILRQKNYYPTRIKIYRESSNIDLSKYTKVPIKDIAIFCRQFYFTISAGINILRALEIVKNQTENRKLKKIFSEILDDVQKGKSLSEAMSKHKDIPAMLINMIEVGEVSGTLDKIMERMAEYYDKEYRFNQKVKQAMTYPMIISIFAILVVIMLMVKVLPIFVSMLIQMGSKDLPIPTRIVIGISNILQKQGIIILMVIIIAGVIFNSYVKSRSGSQFIDTIKMEIPIFGKINKKIITARFARTFGTLMSSGVSLIESIDICSNVVGNKIVSDTLLSSREEVKKGGSLGEALEARGIFPPMLTQMIRIGEESGTLDSILVKTAEFYDGEVETVTAQLATMIEPLIIIVLSGVVGFIVLSILLPIFQMYSAMNGQ